MAKSPHCYERPGLGLSLLSLVLGYPHSLELIAWLSSGSYEAVLHILDGDSAAFAWHTCISIDQSGWVCMG